MKHLSIRRRGAARLLSAFAVAIGLGLSIQFVDVAAQSPGQLPVPLPGRNVNMVSGTNHPDGDPFLQRQNEPTIAVSTRNPQHLFGAANDYRTVDIPGLGDEVNGDAWIGVFKSFDGGQTWRSTLLPGYRQDATTIGKSSPLYGLEAGADPVVRAGTNGLFYLAGMAFDRDQDNGRVFLARYIDNNNLEAGDSIAYLGTTIVDIGNQTRFLDKPWMIVDIPRAMKGEARTTAKDNADRTTNNGVPKKPTAGPVCTVPGQSQPIPAGNIYVVYSVFLDNDSGDENKSTKGKDALERDEDEEERERDEHTPGEPVDGRTKIMIARSTDCGATFSAPHQISDRTQINQGATAAIDPNTGTIYVAWREFLSSHQPDSILVSKSSDGGQTFSAPVVVRTITPFDQGTSSTSFRTNSYPTMAVDASGRVYIAWAQRGVGMSGDTRIVISSSTDGTTWSNPVAADNPPQRGHQFMPVLTFGGGRLHLVFWDQRDDMSKMWGYFIDEAPILNYTGPKENKPTRHTLDLRGMSAWPGAPPTWGPSTKVSNYLEGIMPGKTKAQQLQFNAPNLPLFALGTKPFIGDYLDVTVSPTFIANGDGTWRFNTLSSDPAQFFAAWGDNRDVRPPKDGNWKHYTPPTFAGYTGTSIYDPTQTVEMCKPGQAGMRDQNVYSAKVSSGLIVTTPGNNKRLGFVTDANGTKRLMQRTFVVTVANPDATQVKSIVLHITSQPPGGRASFLQFSQLIDLPVNIAPESSISREVFVTSSDPLATVPITVTEGSSTDPAARLYLNPDPTNPDIDNPDIDNPDIDNPDIDNAEAHAITVSTPDIDNPDIDNVSTLNPDIDNPDIDNPDIDNTRLINTAILNPDIDNPDIDNPDIDNTNILNPDIDNPDIDNPDIDNGALTDVTWNVSNVGNTATSYQVKLLLKQAQQQRLLNAGVKFQLLVTKTTAAPTIDKCAVVEPNRNLTVVKINSPSFVDPTNAEQLSNVLNPDIDNPDIDNATVALAPGDTARVTLRVFSPVGDTSPTEGSGGTTDPLEDLSGALEDLEKIGVATTSHPVDTLAVLAGETTPHIEASIPLIITDTLDDATRGAAYTETIEQTGSVAPFTFSVTTGALPQGLTLNADGTITGSPVVSGTFTFTVKVSDGNDNYASATLTLRVFEPVIVGGATLASAAINQPYSATLSASGGFPPYAWSLAGGTLPAGVTLTTAGVVTGTPTQSGTFNFVAMAMDSALPSKTGVGAFVLNVAAAANPQSVNVVEDTATPITVTGTGSGPFTFAIGNTPAHGTLSGTGPTFTYTPDLNYIGPDSFTFSATQGSLTSAFATVSITVTAVNDAPTATAKTVNTPQGVSIPIVLTGTDPENSPLTFSIVSNPTTGTLSGTAPNVTYNPPPNGFTGTATFTFRVNDGALFSAPATVSVIVGPPPANSADVTLTLADAPDPAAVGNSITYTANLHNNGPAAATGVALSLSYPSSDLLLQSVVPSQGTCTSGNTINCSIGNIANGGNASVTVTLKAFNHAGTFTVSGTASGTLLDYNTANNAASATTTVTGPATATTDLQVSQNRAPEPVQFGGNVVYTIAVKNNGPSDATGVTLTNIFTANTAQFVSSTASQGGCVAGGGQVTCSVDDLASGATATYTVTLKAIGAGTISNTASVTGSQSDTNAGNNSSTVATTVANRPPTATTDAVSTREDQSSTFAVVANDTDLDNDTLSLTIVDQPGHGSTQISGNGVVYTPTANYFGADTFTYQISDGRGGLASGTVNVSVLAVNDAPGFTKGADQVGGVNSGPHAVPGWATGITVGPANEAGQTINFVVSNNNHFLFSSQPEVSPNGTLTYTAAPSGTGTAIVTVTAIDSGGTENGGVDSSASQTFTITISATNDAPAATDDTVTAESGQPTTANALANDTDANNDSLTVLSVTPPAHGTAIIVAGGASITYTSAVGYTGSDSFTYTVSDGHGGTATATVNLIVTFTVCSVPTFSGPRNYPAAAVSDVGDFNQDGHVDIAGARSGVVEIAFGDALGGFGTPTSVGAGSAPKTGDINNDGHLDLVIRNSSNRIAALLGDGTGVFSPAPIDIAVQAAGSTKVVDLNDDGNLDLVVNGVFSPQPAVSIFLGTGTGTFGAETTLTVSNYASNPRIVGDFDGDGIVDLAVGQNTPRQVVILKGDGTGAFTPSTTASLSTGPFALLEVGDLNGDDAADIGVVWNPIAPGPFREYLSLLLSDGSGGFAPLAEVLPGTSLAGTSFARADFNGDGHDDLAVQTVGVGSNGAILVLLGDGAGGFASPVEFLVGAPAQMFAGDLNGDGRPDIFGAHSGVPFALLNSCSSPTTADLTVTATAPTTATSGDTVTYSITVTNQGPDTATGIVFTEGPQFLGAQSGTYGFELLSVTPSAGSCPLMGIAPIIYANCSLPDLAPGASASIDVTARLIGARTVTNKAMATSQQRDPNAANSLATTITDVSANALTFTVTNTANSGAGSLRDALAASNSNIGSTNTIQFNIPGSGPFVITPLTPLPTITVPVVIDGTSQPGYVDHPVVALTANSLPGNGFVINGGGSTIRGLAIGGFNGPAIFLVAGSGNVVEGNYLGTDSTGTVAKGNSSGVAIQSSSSNRIGGTLPGQANLIANNAVGVAINSTNPPSTGNSIRGNSIFNQSVSIALNNGNNQQTYPTLTQAIASGTATMVSGTLASTPNATFAVDFYSSAAGPFREAEIYLGAVSVTTDAAGNAAFNATLPVPTAAGRVITSTATDGAGNTSEISAAVAVTANTPPQTTADELLTVNDFAITSYPGANDIDPDVAYPQVKAVYQPFGAGPVLTSPGEVVIVPGTNRAYFSGANQSIATSGKFGILDLTSNTVSGTIAGNGNVGSSMSAVTASPIVYMRAGTSLQAIDARAASATFNTVILNLYLGNIQAMALDDSRHRLYVTVQTPSFTSMGRIVVIDTDPSTPTFNQILSDLTVTTGNGSATAIAVNTVTNKIYFTATGSSAGLYVLDGATLSTKIVSSGSTATSIAVNDIDNLVFAVANTQLIAVDGATDTVMSSLGLGAPANSGQVNTRIAIHRARGKVFVRANEYPNPSRLFIVDGKRGSVTFNQISTTLAIGRETGQTTMAIDEAQDRLVLTSAADLKTTIVNTATNAWLADVLSNQPSVRVTVDPQSHRAYVAALIGYIQVIDLVTPGVIAVVPVGVEIFGIAANPSTHTAFIASTGVGTTIATVGEAGQTGTVALPHVKGREEYAVRNAATGKTYVLNGASNANGDGDALPGFVHVISAAGAIEASIPVGTLPFGMAVDEIGNKIYVGNGTSGPQVIGGISIIDGGANTVTAANVSAIPLNSGSAGISVGRDMVVNRATGKLYFRITAGSPNQAGVLSTAGVASALPNFGSVNIIKVDPVLNRIYIGATPSNGGSNQIHVLDGANDQEIATLTVGGPTTFVGNQSYVAINTVTGRVFVADFNDEKLTVIDSASNAVIATLPMPFGPSTVAVNETSNRIYVGSAYQKTLTIIDGATLRVASALALPITPVRLDLDTTAAPYPLIFAQSTAIEASVAVVTDPGTAAPPITSVTQASHGTVTLNADGSVTYTPNAGYTGLDSYTYTTTDGFGASTTATATINVLAALEITTQQLPNPTLGTAYSQTVTASGGAGTRTWSLTGNLPGGLRFDAATGAINGVPRQSGSFFFTVTVRDSGAPIQQEDDRSYVLNVDGGTLTMADLREGVILESQPSISFIGGNGTRNVALTAGSLPPGLSLSTAGSFTGSPRRHGKFNFTLELSDCVSGSCSGNFAQQVVQQNISWRVSAKDQQGGSQTQPPISFGGAGGRRLAQVVTVGSQGTLNGIGLNNISCPVGTSVTVDIQRLNAGGVPDGNTIATGVATTNFNAIITTPSIAFAIDERFAFVLSASNACYITNAATTDQYNGGDAYSDAGGGWMSLKTADGRYDISSFRTLITPAIDVRYMTSSHGAATATPLDDGRVLVVGNSTTAQLFDEGLGTFAAASGALSTARFNHTATLLPNGTVLLTGGRDPSGNRLATAEIFDPGTNTFTVTNGPMTFARENHRAVWFVNNGVGRVLITGGVNSGGSTFASAELYDPLTQTFTSIGDMLLGRQQHTITLLDNNKILITGGFTNGSPGPSAELYDPATGQFTATTGAMIVGYRGIATATKLNDGTVLIAGGQSGDIRAEAEIYNPATNTFSATSSMSTKRYFHTATLLTDGSVLVAGGFDQQSLSNYTLALATMERYVPGTGWVGAGGLETRRQQHAAALLPTGKVLIVGGFGQSYMNGNTGEFFDLNATPTFTPTTLADATPGNFYSVTFTGSGGSGSGYTITHVSGVLPPGMTYDSSTQTLSGSAASGVYRFALQVADDDGHTNAQTLTLRVGSVLTIDNPYRLIDAAQNEPYNVPLTATGVLGTLEWSVLPAVNNPLPPGITLSGGGLLSGSPTTVSYYNFGVRVVDKVDGAIVAEAVKILSISVRAPLTITTTTVAPPQLFNANASCLSSTNGTGTTTWTLVGGALPPGMTLSTNGCFSGGAGAFGTFNFTVKVTDQSSVPQEDTKALSFTVATLNDQGSSSDSAQPALSFGGVGGNLIGERVITGVTGMLSGVRFFGSSICPTGTSVTAQVQGVAVNGGPDGNVIATGTALYSFDYIPFNVPPFFTADQTFTIVFSADNSCSVRPSTFDSYPGEGYVYTTEWKRLKEVETRYDIPFQTIVTPSAGLGLMKSYRSQPTAITLNDGRVLLFSDTTSEIYDPATNTFTQSGNLTVQRTRPAATLLADGRVLVTGGYNFPINGGSIVYLSSAEIFDPLTGQWTATAAMSTARAYHTATRLDDGRVLITGGQSIVANVFTTLRTTEIYTVGTGFSAGPNMLGFRNSHTATLLDDGRVLIAGGFGSYPSSQSAELYTAGTPGSFAATTNPMQVTFRARHTATRMANGLVLIAGGSGATAGGSAELFNPADQTFTSVGSLAQPRVDHTATLLNDGTVLLAGGLDDAICCGPYPPKSNLERYEYPVGFSNAGSMAVSRYLHSATLISGTDKVLFAGTTGWSSAGGRLSEIYDPATAVALDSVNAPPGQVGVAYPGITLAAHGGTGPYTITLLSGTLPGGLTYNGGTASITGTPTQSGTFVSTFKVEDSAAHAATQTITIRVDALTITTVSLPSATINLPYTFTLSATGGSGAKTWALYSGTLPQGFNLAANGTVSGTANTTGFSSLTVRVTDANGQMALRSYGFSVLNPLTITTTALGESTAGNTYFGCIGWSNGVFPLAWSVSGVPGLQFQNNGSSNCFDTTYPARIMRQGGNFVAQITATDSSNPPQQATKNLAVRLHGQDQSMGGQTTAAIPLPTSRRVAQVFRVATSYPSSGVQLWNISSCTANTAITATLRPVSGMPERPDETGAPLAQATVTTSSGGFFNSLVSWPSTVTLPQGGLFAIVISFANGSCSGVNWPTDDFYTWGQGWVDDNGSGWTRAGTAIGRPDVPIGTLVMPASDLLFTQTWRSTHVTTTLADGRILILGGYDNTAEIYDPVTHTIAQTPGNMSSPRQSASATLLNSNKVLIVGGNYYDNTLAQTVFVSTAELFDPVSGLFSAAAALPAGRYDHTATRLNNNKVLIAGGRTINYAQTDVAVLYEADGLSNSTISMTGARSDHSATKLGDGRVLIAGGYGGSPYPASAEIFDPAAGTFTATANAMLEWQPQHTATLLTTGPNAGKVLIAGGFGSLYPDLADSQYYDPNTDSFEDGPDMAVPRYEHTAITLSDGRVLIVGGAIAWEYWRPTASVEIYDPVNQDFEQVPDLVVDRYASAVERLSSGPYSGQVLVVGGNGSSSMSGRTVEHYGVDTSTMVIEEKVMPPGTSGINYAADYTVYGNTVGPVTFSLVSGSLPNGLTLNADGTITGAPTQSSFNTFVVRAEDTASHVAFRASSIRVDPLRITTNTLPPGLVNQPYSQQMEYSGGVGIVTWSVNGALPQGFTLSASGELSGQSSSPLSVWISVRAVDETGYSWYQSLLLEVLDPIDLEAQPQR
jgi:uncharacterized repeat protein (TIGR01451 family)